MHCLQFHDTPSAPPKGWQALIMRLLSGILPSAPPDLDRKIHQTTIWLLAFEHPDEPPVREIGLDAAGRVLLKLPDTDGWCYWADTHMDYHDFQQSFACRILTEAEFETLWQSDSNKGKTEKES